MAGSDGGRTNRSTRERIVGFERAARVLELRKTGMSFTRIARATGYTKAGAYGAFRRALLAIVQEPAEEVRVLEVARLDALLESLWATAIAGDLRAVDRVLAVMTRRASLLGLDAPQRVDIQHEARMIAESVGLDEAEAVRIAEQVVREMSR